jgi:O-antigen/teichoic acid export membrane protein
MGAIAAWVAVMTLEILTSETYRGFQDLRMASLFGGVITGFVSVLLLLGAWLTRGAASLNHVILITVAAMTISLMIALAILARRVSRLESGAELRTREVLSISMPLWVSSITAMLLLRVDLWILGAYVPKEDLGYYFAAWRLVNLVSMPLMLVVLVVPPFIAELYARGEKKRLERVLRNAATLGGLPAFSVLVAFVLFGGPIMQLVYTEEFRAGATILAVLSLGKIINVWTGSCGVTMSMTGYQSPLMGITVVSSIAVVVGCLLVVERYGAIGVASVVSGGLILQNLTQWLAARYFTGMWTHASVPRWHEIRTLLDR